jgi:hypothetical protein
MHRVAAALLAAGMLAGTLAGSPGAAGSGVTPQEKAQARQALLVLSDFPKGRRSSPNSSSKLPGPKGFAAFELSSSGDGAFGQGFVSCFFFYKQFGDVVAAFSLSPGTNVQPLAQRLLNVARSRL